MSISISGSLSSLPSVASSSPSTPTTAQPAPKADTDDTVKLSQAAQVHLLKQQGQTLSQIASNLSIPITTVDNYLGIAVTKPASASTQQPAQVQDNSAKTPETPTAVGKG
jgi:DNA-binding CsgD family transcriptional regulator